MNEYRDLMRHISCKHNKYDDMIDYKIFMEELMDKMEKHYPELYRESMTKLEEIAYSLNLDKAREKVVHMRPFGEHWNYDTVKQYIESKGIYKDCVKYYLVMNMVYNDYYDVATNFGHQSDTEFYYELANAFINDEDGGKFKVEKYFSD